MPDPKIYSQTAPGLGPSLSDIADAEGIREEIDAGAAARIAAAAPCCAECGRPLGPIPASARNKRFCSARCRSAFHTKELRAFREGLRQQQQQEPQS